MRRKPAVFLDRDGVINIDQPGYVTSWEGFHFHSGALEAIAELTTAGWEIYVITNQSGITRGLYSRQRLVEMHWRMLLQIRKAGGRVLGVQFCPHTDEDGCMCRKPQPGMLYKAAAKWGLDLARSCFIGDTARDIQAGSAAGCTTFWIATHYSAEETQRQRDMMVSQPDYEVQDLAEAVRIILAGAGPSPANAAVS